jgi:hypothetical protein
MMHEQEIAGFGASKKRLQNAVTGKGGQEYRADRRSTAQHQPIEVGRKRQLDPRLPCTRNSIVDRGEETRECRIGARTRHVEEFIQCGVNLNKSFHKRDRGRSSSGVRLQPHRWRRG